MNELQPLTRVGLATGQLTDEEINYIDKKVVKTVYPILVGRTLFPPVPLGHAGYRKVTFYSETDMAAAVIDMEGQKESMDTVPKAPHEVTLPVLHKEFLVLWRDVAMSRHNGVALDVSHAENAARQVAELEDLLLISGESTTYPLLGIRGLATALNRLTQASAGAWPANVITDVTLAIAQLEAAGFYGPYKLLLTPIWRATLRAMHATADEWYFKLVGELIGGVENIVVTSSLFSATGGVDSAILTQPGEDNYDMVVGEDVHTITSTLKNKNIWGSVRDVVAPRIKRPTSICEITGIT